MQNLLTKMYLAGTLVQPHIWAICLIRQCLHSLSAGLFLQVLAMVECLMIQEVVYAQTVPALMVWLLRLRRSAIR